MEQIFPLREDVVQQYCGLPVCVVMNDGTRHIGILSSCRGGRVMLNADADSGTEAVLNKVQPQASKKKKAGKGSKAASQKPEQAQTQSFPYDPYYYGTPYYPWGEALALEFALIAFLFLLL